MASFNAELIRNFEIEFDRLRSELRYYQKDESLLWKKAGNVNNPPGNLALHLVGNLNHFIGNMLGESGYQRNRKAEFELKDVPLTDLVALLNSTEEVVIEVIKNLGRDKLREKFPENVFGFEMSVSFMLIRLLAHLSYHTGQISYHRRIINA